MLVSGIAPPWKFVNVLKIVDGSVFLAGMYNICSFQLLQKGTNFWYYRGCATEEQCVDSGGDIYDGTKILSNGESAGGMTTTLTCCKAEDYADDDVIAVDYGSICNAATTTSSPFSLAYVIILTVSAVLVFSSAR